MEKKSNVSLYIGLLLVLSGVVVFLDLNGILPKELFPQYINFIIGIVLLIAYFRTKQFPLLLVASFFICNGGLLLIDKYVDGWNYLAGVALIPGILFMIAFIAKKHIGFLIPGSLLTSWGICILLISAGVLSGFTMIIGMSFVFTALGFLMIYIYTQEGWSGIPCLIFAVIGVVIVALGLGELSRLILFNVMAIIIVVIGLIMISRSFLGQKKEQGDKGEN